MTQEKFSPGTEGIFYDLPAHVYHAAPGVSNSMLGELARSPAHLQAYLNRPHEQTRAMLIGTIVHSLLLQPEAFPFWAVKPAGMSLATREGKEWKEKAGGREIIDADEWECIKGMAESVMGHRDAAAALESGRPEVSVFKNFTLGNTVLRRLRIDFVNSGNCLVDIKTTEDARDEAFSRALHDWMYYMQAAYYLDGWNDACHDLADRKELFVFIVVEKKPPFAVNVFDLHRDAIGAGRVQYIRLLQKYMECTRAKKWPAYEPGVRTINLPERALRKVI